MTVLLDTGFIIAPFNKRDRHHRWAARLMRNILKGAHGTPFITDYIIDEVLSYAAARLGREVSLKLGRLMLEEAGFQNTAGDLRHSW